MPSVYISPLKTFAYPPSNSSEALCVGVPVPTCTVFISIASYFFANPKSISLICYSLMLQIIFCGLISSCVIYFYDAGIARQAEADKRA
jgi:hypothetical protein